MGHEFINVDVRAVAININQTYRPEMNSAELYDFTRGVWRLDRDRADNAKIRAMSEHEKNATKKPPKQGEEFKTRIHNLQSLQSAKIRYVSFLKKTGKFGLVCPSGNEQVINLYPCLGFNDI